MPDAFFSSTKPRKRKRTQSVGGTDKSSRPAKKQTKPDAHSKGKRVNGPSKVNGSKQKKRQDEELHSDQTDESDGGGIDDMDLRAASEEVHSGDEYADETPADKRLRLARLYLESVKEGLADGEFDAKEIDKELISARLRQDVLEHSGKVHQFIADSFNFEDPPRSSIKTKGHRFSVTSAVAAESGRYLFTSGKEGHIIKWDMTTGKKLATLFKVRSDGKGKGKVPPAGDVKGHTDEVLALALSSDGKYLVSGGRDRRVVVWDAEKAEWIKCFTGPMCHRDAVSSLSFRKATHQLYSGSFDRTLKVFDLTPSVMGYVETLYGHQDHVLAVDALRLETCVSVGARDKTARFWKIVDETQLVFRGGGRSKVREMLEGGLRGDDDVDDTAMDVDGRSTKRKGKEAQKFIEASLECIAMIDESTFVSGGDSGSISLWSTTKKKPIFTQPLAHGLNEAHSETEGIIQTPRWVTALASLRYSDIFASGSWDGDIRIWKLDAKLKSFELAGKLSLPGVINSLQLLSPPKGFLSTTSWLAPLPPPSSQPDEPTTATRPSKNKIGLPESILLVAGVGQEHRLGRWLSVKEDSFNGSFVAVYSPRTLN
ncbi:pre-rRNA processing protein [Pleurotus pulmonarius]|nr:pre-rRNA processing protein [Pleurotus pulmonarius]KAF4607897.1 pre-rRNA processing protein [Pleurotus pulmonarius]